MRNVAKIPAFASPLTETTSLTSGTLKLMSCDHRSNSSTARPYAGRISANQASTSSSEVSLASLSSSIERQTRTWTVQGLSSQALVN